MSVITGGSLNAQQARLAALTVKISGLRDGRGCLRVALFDHAGGFPNDSARAVAHREVPLARQAPLNPTLVTFDGLPPGRYAVSVLHDRSGTGRMEMDFLGRPKDEWGVSNNPHPLFRAPHFSEAEIKVEPQETKTVMIVLRR